MEHFVIRKVLRHGASVGVTIPPEFGLRLGEWVRIAFNGDEITIKKIGEEAD